MKYVFSIFLSSFYTTIEPFVREEVTTYLDTDNLTNSRFYNISVMFFFWKNDFIKLL